MFAKSASSPVPENVSDSLQKAMLTLELFTPSDDDRPVFITGNFNGWKTRDEQFRMTKVSPGRYRFEFKQELNLGEPFEYKYVKGGWEGEELSAEGHAPQNRRMEIARGKVSDTVPRWKKHEGWYDASYFPDIQLVSKRFNLPQLGRRRRISILLPFDYHTTEKRYPVLYLQDGQNLFEPHAPFGTWGVDRQLAFLSQRGLGGFIVVAIDHGGKERIREFSPYGHLKWGEGLGREYARFLAETLKPYIDRNYKTLAGREHTGIGGSSMGGLISIFAGMMFPEVYSKFMIFSPSLWVSPRIFNEPVRFDRLSKTKIYLYAGGKEGAGMVANSEKFTETLRKRGFDSSKLEFRLEVDPNGRHNEERWGREFPKAAEWLFA